MFYLLWYCDNPKKPPAQKIAEAMHAYTARFHASPTVVLCNEAELCEVAGVEVRSEGYVRKSNFWIGEIGQPT